SSKLDAVRRLQLPSHPPTIDCQHGAGDIVARRRAQKKRSSRKVLRLPPASSRDAFEDLAIPCLVRLQRLRVRRRKVAGSNRIHLNAFGGPLVSKRLGQLSDPALTRSVRRNANASLKTQQRSDVHDLPAVHADP